MMIAIIKFIHVLLTLSLLGIVIYCLMLMGSKKLAGSLRENTGILRLGNITLVLSLLAMLTGTLLVIPKHFTFHTPWIRAAYILLVLFGLGMVLLMKLKKRQLFDPHRSTALSRKEQVMWQLAYVALIILLVSIIHDAVTKTTFLFTAQ